MAHHVIEYDCECDECHGTGLFVGMAEHDGAAVVCYTCKGTGMLHGRLEYDDFDGRKGRDGIRRVYRTNPGIGIGEGDGFKLEDFGGMPVEDWCAGKPFPAGSEMRRYTCPRWWYQRVDYRLVPEWGECACSGFFSDCPHFPDKAGCWARWDKEQAAHE